MLATSAVAARPFRPRIGAAMGIVAPAGHQEQAVAQNAPVDYHGGSVMRNVSIHTIFWAPSGFHFDGSPSLGVLGYEQLIQQFFTDAAHDSGATGNVFSVLSQYGDGSGAGRYSFSYSPATDSIDATDPYPASSHRCASPSGVTMCVTDLELQQEVNRVIRAHSPGARGLNNIWFVFLPPDVDTCIQVDECGSNVFGGYHSVSDLGAGPTIYVNIPDPQIALTPGPGSDPQGNPEAESSIDTAAHEAVEAISDPVGTGWLDLNGFEAADKCESGPEQGTPLGYSADGSPFNQLIGGHEYLIQMMWSNTVAGCVQNSSATSSSLPLPTVSMRQFSSSLSGNIGSPMRGVSVLIGLERSGTLVALGSARTRSGGGWGPVSLRSADGTRHAVGDDRDELLVDYGRHGPAPDLIETGDGGDPFTQSGWTGWFDLDNGYAASSNRRGGTVLLGPCSQTGVLALTVDGAFTEPPAELCQTESDVSVLHTRPLGPGSTLAMSSEDNRAVTGASPNGALVKLTVALGEPGSVSALTGSEVGFNPSGFPSCTAQLRSQTVGCAGLVPGARYTLTRRRGHAIRRVVANPDGTINTGPFPGRRGIRGGDVVALRNRVRRVLTTLHVAHLRVDIDGDQTRLASGTCEPGDYYGLPLQTAPASLAVGEPGSGGTGTICPLDGHAKGLPTADIAQTDDFGGGQTRTEVPFVQATSPLEDETLYGSFVASAQSGLPGPNGSIISTGAPVALAITRAASRRRVFHASDVDTARGVAVAALAPGSYVARWVLSDANGDTRTLLTRFVQER